MHNEFQTQLLNQSGKFEAELTQLQGQLNDFTANYLQVREHKELIQLKENKFNDERDRLLKMLGELEAIVEDLEWKLSKCEKDCALASEELASQLSIKSQIE